MSLLPGTILFPSMPFTSQELDAEGKPTGKAMIEMNWWLFLYNLSLNVLGTPGGGGNTVGLPASALIELAALEADAANTDSIALRRSLDSQAVLTGPLTEVDIDVAAMRQFVSNALLLSQEALLPDSIPQAQPVQAITVGASVFTYTAPANGQVAVTGGTVSAISFVRQGTTVVTGLTVGLIPVSRRDQVQVTYTVVPTMNFIPA